MADAKSHGLTHMLIYEATQTGECWDEIKGILRLKLCNANIHTYTLWRYNRKPMKLLQPISITSRQQLSDAPLTMTLAILIFVKGLRDAPTIPAEIYENNPCKLCLSYYSS